MFLFFGTRVRRRPLGRGTFHCPYCFTHRAYEHTEARTWFHLFWVPLFPLGAARDGVRCTVCDGEWGPAVLTSPPPGASSSAYPPTNPTS